MGGDDLAVGKQLTRVVKEDDAVAQQTPALFGMGGHDARGFPVVGFRRGAGGLMWAHGSLRKARHEGNFRNISSLNALVQKSAVLG